MSKKPEIIGLLIFVALCFVGVIGGGVADRLTQSYKTQSQTENDFRAACAAVKGHAVWNGAHWECLK